MGRPPSSCCGEELRREDGAMKKGAWTAEEDEKLVAFIKRNKGHGSWRTLPKLAGLDRCGKSCRLRWTNYLRPNIKRGNFSPDEERIIVQLHAVLGNKWSAIASHLPGRTDNEVKNHWNTHLKKRLTKMGIDPATHLPFNVFTAQRHLHSNPTASMSNADWQKILLQHSLQVNSTMACHLLQWEIARLEAEARQQIASSHGAYIQNYCTSWLQNLHQNQSDHAYDLNAPLGGAANAQVPVHSQSLPNVSSSNQFHVSQNSENKHLGSIPLSLCQGHDDTSPSINSLQNLQCPALSNEESEQLQDDCVLTSASTGALDSCGSSDSLSSPLLPSHFDVPDDLLSLDLSSDESRNLASIINPQESSPLTLDDPPTGQQDSYWNRVLYFLDQGTLGSL